MATIAYTSTAINPKLAQVDLVLAQAALPLANTRLYGDAEDVGNPAAAFTWKWYLLDKPSTATTAFIDPDTSQNPLVGPFDVWGNYLFLLVATSDMAGGASEGNRLKAPQTALVQVRVQSNTFTLEKPARWARKWTELYWKLVDKFQSHTILEHVDVNTATGAKLDKLCDGSLAEDPLGTPMHVHGASAFTPATMADLGVVKLSTTPIDPANPVVLNAIPYAVSGHSDGSITAHGYLPGQIVPQAGNKPHALVYIPYTAPLDSIEIMLADGGDGAGNYTFDIYIGSAAQWLAGTQTLVVGATISAGSTAHGVWWGSYVFIPNLSHGLKPWIGVVCTNAPAVPGSKMSVIINAVQPL